MYDLYQYWTEIQLFKYLKSEVSNLNIERKGGKRKKKNMNYLNCLAMHITNQK